jgi:hypothetical protein
MGDQGGRAEGFCKILPPHFDHNATAETPAFDFALAKSCAILLRAQKLGLRRRG